MIKFTKSIDQLVEKQELRHDELRQLSEEIKKSTHKIVIGFVDLADSTNLKQNTSPDVWLGTVYRFLKRGESLVRQADGEIIKRIGDELMITFLDKKCSERFLKLVQEDDLLKTYRFKIAFDYGDVHHLNFGKIEDDPYGEVVDRCSRIAKFAGAGAIVCSSSYRSGSHDNEYLLVGTVGIKGFRELQEIFSRPIYIGDKDYLVPLLNAVNDGKQFSEGFKSISRTIDADFIHGLKAGTAKPFLARELLNLPRLGFSAEDFYEFIETYETNEKRRACYGYYVEWSGVFKKFSYDRGGLTIEVGVTGAHLRNYFEAIFPMNFLEAIKILKNGDFIKVRGVICYLLGTAELNYADFEILEKAPNSQKQT